MKHHDVVAAIIVHDQHILAVQRPHHPFSYISEKFEFPGGKVEAGETHEAALVREIKEELSMDIRVQSHFLTVEHTYPDFKLTMRSYICHCSSPQLSLNEHISYQWLETHQLEGLDWAAADIPIVNELINLKL